MRVFVNLLLVFALLAPNFRLASAQAQQRKTDSSKSKAIDPSLLLGCWKTPQPADDPRPLGITLCIKKDGRIVGFWAEADGDDGIYAGDLGHSWKMSSRPGAINIDGWDCLVKLSTAANALSFKPVRPGKMGKFEYSGCFKSRFKKCAVDSSEYKSCQLFDKE